MNNSEIVMNNDKGILLDYKQKSIISSKNKYKSKIVLLFNL